MTRIAVMTGGGDAPGLNAALRAVALAAYGRGWECVGLRASFNGLLERAGTDGLLPLPPDAVQGILDTGGTMLGTTNHGDPFRWPGPDGTVDRSDDVLAACARLGIAALVMIGGDGTMRIAAGLSRKGLRVVGVPKTIDGDVQGAGSTLGFASAVAYATEAIDRLHCSAQSHERAMVVEVMGRYAGWIALHAGLAGGAHAILLPEIPFDLEAVARLLAERDARNRPHDVVVVAEGAHALRGSVFVADPVVPGRSERLGGVGAHVARQLELLTGKESRAVVLGHLLRGGSPVAADRIAALRMGEAAVRALAEGRHGVMMTLHGDVPGEMPLVEVRTWQVPADHPLLATARALGVCLGE
ncbi:6-phosphofructokinase [Pseudoduganella flava]|uniref:6-phosphofructokinase n=1 Tax=Pseudoduganella flava TaxID=871742 RepID=A0A562PBP0_9BURK|nr:ATP-dependent 6-phosphofructokinase [Pseudoduganella flava]QGZ38009.1 ATP-dependent 6-phosphofructokinase [Pseudoduganella flava]TWI41834.1 6-phosphofructokinase [Pseudoduganella flava]